MLASRPYRTVLGIAATVLMGSMLTRAAERSDFNLSAHLRIDRLELQLRVSAVCVRVVAQLPARVTASAHLFSCEGGCLRPRTYYVT
jgi:hypothetical protein